MCELAKRITVPVTMDFMSVSSYGAGTKSSGIVKIVKDLDQSIEGRDVLVVEDIIDSGRTLSHLMKILNERKPSSICLCTLLDKPERREVDDVNVDYTGFQVPDEFVVGYGLDYDQLYRNLPYVGVVETEQIFAETRSKLKKSNGIIAYTIIIAIVIALIFFLQRSLYTQTNVTYSQYRSFVEEE